VGDKGRGFSYGIEYFLHLFHGGDLCYRRTDLQLIKEKGERLL